jgi:hypothetical protein
VPASGPKTAPSRAAATFYTDKSVYQPGDTLHYKVLLTSFSLDNPGRPLVGRQDTVLIRDEQNRTVLRQPLISSDYGTYSGQFVFPDTLTILPGQAFRFQLQASAETQASSSWHPALIVEGPKVSTSSPLVLTGPYPALSAEQQVQVQGSISLPAGHPWWQGNRQVRYWIVRRAVVLDSTSTGQLHYVYHFDPEIIREGVQATTAEGSFSISFTARLPAASLMPAQNLGYQYRVIATALLEPGATAALGLYVGNLRVPVQDLELQGPALVNRESPEPFTLQSFPSMWRAYSEATRGWLSLYRLQPPLHMDAAPGSSSMASHSAGLLNRADTTDPSRRELAATWSFDTGKESVLHLPASVRKMFPGAYLLIATTYDSLGNSSGSERSFVLYSKAGRTLPVPAADWFVAPPTKTQVGEQVQMLLGTSHSGSQILLETGIADSVFSRQWVSLAPGEQYRWTITVPPSWEGKQVWLGTTQLYLNQVYSHSASFQVVSPAPNPLQVRLSKKGNLQVRNQAGQAMAAELVATLVTPHPDASGHNRELQFATPILPMLSASAGLPPWQLNEKITIATPDDKAAAPEIYWPLAGNPQLGQPQSSEWNNSEDSLLIRDIQNIALGQSQPQSKVALPDPLVQEAFYGPLHPYVSPQLDEASFWQPAAYTNRRGRAALSLPATARISPHQLLVLAHTKDGNVGQLRQGISISNSLSVQALVAKKAGQDQKWIVTTEVRNDGITTRQGSLRISFDDNIHVLGKQIHGFRVAPGERVTYTWILKAKHDPRSHIKIHSISEGRTTQADIQ